MRGTIISTLCECLSKVSPEYYKLKTTYEPSGIVRERVFCYELHHQLRKFQECNPGHIINSVTLNGEIDKSGHKEFEKADRKNPDFIFHTPGQMGNNTAVIEVKGKLDRVGKREIGGFMKKKCFLSFVVLAALTAFSAQAQSGIDIVGIALGTLKKYMNKPVPPEGVFVPSTGTYIIVLSPSRADLASMGIVFTTGSKDLVVSCSLICEWDNKDTAFAVGFDWAMKLEKSSQSKQFFRYKHDKKLLYTHELFVAELDIEGRVTMLTMRNYGYLGTL